MALSNPVAYRYPNERLILATTVFLVLLVIVATATATFCGSLLFVVVMVALAYWSTRAHHDELMRGAHPVTPDSQPQFDALVRECAARLRTGPVHTYIVPGQVLNAYTFGLSEPQVVVLYAPLFRLMDADELRFVVGHELGHVRLGHTWLNSLVGGMAGIPSPFFAAVLLQVAFRWWNRACEFSADRAGLLACGSPDTAVSALVRLTTGSASRDPAAMAQALQHLDAEDDDPSNVVLEALATHPLMIRRIVALRRYAASPQYARLRAEIEG
jgi:Zn-dependent protease with chaperone function